MASEEMLRTYLKRATADLAEARRRLAEARNRDGEPIAVIGMACRFPGADDVDAYWKLLREGRAAAVTEVPAGRFDHDPHAAGNDLYPPRRGAFLRDIAGWDAGLFGFSHREALRMDPQQRLLMDLTWQAMEDTGTPPARLAGSRTGVLLGFSDAFQYGQLQADLEGRNAYTDPYMGQGSLASVVAGRIAYHFDLRGPALSLDTACSSALVAVHLAAQALRNRECDYALAGGAYLALHPFLYIYSCSSALLSPTDQCHTFDASADGYLMGEGGGMVMLARLSDALRAGHRIRAVIRGSAVNQDGRSNGLTAPNRGAQVAVIRQALAAAGAGPDDVAYLEAHGSGTRLGDEIEFSALNDVFAGRAAQRPLRVGAVKTNIGHTHTAAGIAGLIKTVLVLEHGMIPPNLNMAEPSEAVRASDAVRPADGLIRLTPDGGTAPVAGVSSFGWSGTNAHVVLEAPPTAVPVTVPMPEEPVAHLLPVSAATQDVLGAQLTRLSATAGRVPLADLAHTLQSGRSPLGCRRAVVAADPAEAAARLTAASGQPGTCRTPDRPKVAFLLPGVGDQYRGMGKELYRGQPAFARAVDECIAVATGQFGIDLHPVFFGSPPAAPGGFLTRDPGPSDELLEHAQIGHPYLFAVEYALARQLASYGITPDLLVGYSLGEYTAACLAGVFSLDDALSVVIERARLIEAAPPGRMLAAAADGERIGELLAGCSPRIGIAALNGPGMTVLSGPPADIEAAAAQLAEAGVASRVLRSAHPFHSALLEPAQEKLAAVIAAVHRQAPRIPVVSNVTGRPLTEEQATDPQYWARHLCMPVRFAAGTRYCMEREISGYVELGPGQALGMLVRQNADGEARPAVLGTLAAPWLASQGPDENVALLQTCGRLWEIGCDLDWPALRRGTGRHAALPGYPFQRTPFWPHPAERQTTARQAADQRRASPAGQALCYTAAWRLDPARPACSAEPGGTLVIFRDDAGIGARLAELASAGGARVVEVVPGTGLRRTGREIVIDPADPEHYRQIFATLEAPAGLPVRVVHLWSLLALNGKDAFAGDADLREAVRYAFDSLLLTIQALGAISGGPEVRLITVSAGAEEITGRGDVPAPARAMVHGLARGARGEYPGLSWRGVDLEPDSDPGESAAHLAAELRRGPWRYPDPAAEPALAGWRGGRRWLKGWAELMPAQAGGWDPAGTYLITGGTRGLGMALARDLVRNGVRQLALVSRTDLHRPRAAAEPDERTARSLRDVAELTEAGARVLLLTADVGVPGELRGALREARDHFGTLDVVVHAAGVPGGGMAARRTVTQAAKVLAPKVLAMGPLAELAGPATPAELRPRLLVLYSSVATVIGGLGESEYCAANAVLDAYGTALATAAGETQVISVAWGQWQHDAWPSELSGRALDERVAYRQRYGFTDAAGCALLGRLAVGRDGAVNGAVVAVGQPLPDAIRDWAAINDLSGMLEASPAPADRTRFPRPALRADYAPPRTELETTIADVWADYLGIDAVGVDDPFFDLGGNSLVGTAMVTALQRMLGRHIAPALLFQHPTVATFAAALSETAQASTVPDGTGASRGERRRRASVRTSGHQDHRQLAARTP